MPPKNRETLAQKYKDTICISLFAQSPGLGEMGRKVLRYNG